MKQELLSWLGIMTIFVSGLAWADKYYVMYFVLMSTGIFILKGLTDK